MKLRLAKISFRDGAANIFPYLILLILSFLALYVFFYEGLLQGDDIVFHLANISDEYLSIINQGSISRISTYLGSNLGIGTRLFYSPLFHLLASLLYASTQWLGTDAVEAIKIVMFVSVFVSGLFMYRFLLKVTNGKTVASMIGAAIYVLYPYRIFDALCRAAYAEALAFVFIPLFFKGLYGLVNFKEKITVLPFVEVILGGSLLFLSHNLTAVFGFIFGVIFLLANTHKIIILCRQPRYWITGLLSIVFLVGIMSVTLFSSLELMSSGLYNISNPTRMWTTIGAVTSRIDTAFSYSGFLNYLYMNGAFGVSMGPSALTSQIISFLLLSAFFFVLHNTLGRIRKLRFFRLLISAAIYLGLMFVFANRLEVILGAAVVVLLTFAIDYVWRSAQNKEIVKGTIYKDVNFWFLIAILVLTFALITQKWLWRIMPEPLLMIQFPWRLFAFIQFFASWAIAWLCYKFEFKKAVPYAAVTALGFCLVASQALPEKRLNMLRASEPESSMVVYHGDEDYFAPTSSIGWNKEYIPQVFFQNGYVSEYSNTLYYSVKQRINQPYLEAYPLNPVALSGDCVIDVVERETPNYELGVTPLEDSLVQMPLIYYPGYRIDAYDADGTKTNLEAQNIDGLIAFELAVNHQRIGISFIGSPLIITSYVYFGLSVIGTAGLVVWFKCFDRTKKEKPDDVSH